MSDQRRLRLIQAWVLTYPLSAQRRLIRLGGCPGWAESSLGAVILLVLLWGCSYSLSKVPDKHVCNNMQMHKVCIFYTQKLNETCHTLKETISCSFVVYAELAPMLQYYKATELFRASTWTNDSYLSFIIILSNGAQKAHMNQNDVTMLGNVYTYVAQGSSNK